jgi:uncharacterized caspase-like protein
MDRWVKGKVFILILLCAIFFPSVGARDEKKVALVIGNSAYKSTAQLRNPFNDATKLSEAFKRLSFEVISGINMTKADMDMQVQLFSDRMRDASVVVFFYAGHGMQINSKNFLVPVDFNPLSGTDLGPQLVSLDNILHEMEKGEHVNIVFLDACRDNPLADQLASNLAKGRSIKLDEERGVRVVRQGLAEVEGKAGTLIAYATQPGNVALDGSGDNSPFTEALLQYVEEPGLEIRDILTNVRMRVMNKTEKKQIPWDHSSLVKKIYFKEKPKVLAPPP